LQADDHFVEANKKIECAAIESVWESMKGMPYVWGGESFDEGGFDCSGAVYHVQKAIGWPVPRTTSAKYFILAKGEEKHWKDGLCGDWIWWTLQGNRPYGHIGMHTRQPVVWQSGSSTGPIDVMLFDSSFWDRHFAGTKSLT
jgi:cell wall-associated NlpC family hydrolase